MKFFGIYFISPVRYGSVGILRNFVLCNSVGYVNFGKIRLLGYNQFDYSLGFTKKKNFIRGFSTSSPLFMDFGDSSSDNNSDIITGLSTNDYPFWDLSNYNMINLTVLQRLDELYMDMYHTPMDKGIVDILVNEHTPGTSLYERTNLINKTILKISKSLKDLALDCIQLEKEHANLIQNIDRSEEDNRNLDDMWDNINKKLLKMANLIDNLETIHNEDLSSNDVTNLIYD